MTVDTSRLTSQLEILETRGEVPDQIHGLAYDSRKVRSGACFVALRGTQTDGHRFVGAAEAAGATLAVVEELPVRGGLPCIRVSNTLATMPLLAAAFFDHPARKLTLAGFTGTNGKTSSTYLLEAVWAAADVPSAVIGTIEYRWRDRSLKAPNTTPLALDLHELFDGIVRAGIHHVAMEVSSHGLCLHRVDDLLFKAAAFTNLSPEHLDFHTDLEDYREAKARLFERHLAPDGHAVVNTDDEHGRILFDRMPHDRRMSFGLGENVEITAEDIQYSQEHTTFELKTPSWSSTVRSLHAGEHNLRNMLGVAGMGIALGLREEAVVQGLEAVTTIPGRLEVVNVAHEARILVDFAHTPDGLLQVLTSLKALPHNRIVTVFGCGGDRDRSKRPLMGNIARQYSDLAILTSDNPRTEDPERIIEEVVAGMGNGDGRYEIVPDRRNAIARALGLVGEGDILLIAGKGHETTQILGTVRHPFDDREVVREIVGKGSQPGCGAPIDADEKKS
jgi:UDP-N-acetylmuramoyl-L-alanyl-D-glutamate--2,6-diaminopimelate ligase